jgi:hypothetical protein
MKNIWGWQPRRQWGTTTCLSCNQYTSAQHLDYKHEKQGKRRKVTLLNEVGALGQNLCILGGNTFNHLGFTTNLNYLSNFYFTHWCSMNLFAHKVIFFLASINFNQGLKLVQCQLKFICAHGERCLLNNLPCVFLKLFLVEKGSLLWKPLSFSFLDQIEWFKQSWVNVKMGHDFFWRLTPNMLKPRC